MKRSFLILFLITLISSHYLISMEKDNSTIIATLDTAINKKYPSHFLSLLDSSLKEHDFLIIANIANQSTLNTEIINNLSKNSEKFKSAIDYFSSLAYKNVKEVTLDTLEAVLDASLEQSIANLNYLPLSIKQYVMDKAYNSIHNKYTLQLAGHTDTILDIDICDITNVMVSSSRDKTVRLWDLKSAKSIYMFPEDDCVYRVKFNPDGSRIATVTNYNDNSNIIKIWSINPAQLMHTFEKQNGNINILRFSSKDNKLEAYTADKKPSLTIFSIDSPPHIITHIEKIPYTIKKSDINKNDKKLSELYEFNHHSLESGDPTIHITKKDCRLFYLTLQAIQNTQHRPQKDLKTFSLFQKLTQCEQEKIAQELKKKFSL